jgi:hypothetical protein
MFLGSQSRYHLKVENGNTAWANESVQVMLTASTFKDDQNRVMEIDQPFYFNARQRRRRWGIWPHNSMKGTGEQRNIKVPYLRDIHQNNVLEDAGTKADIQVFAI